MAATATGVVLPELKWVESPNFSDRKPGVGLDLIVVHEDGRDRVQVKTTTMKVGNSYVVHLRTVGGNKSQVIARPFDPTDYEWLFVVCADATAYLIPSSEITSRESLSLGRKYERFRLED